MKIPEVALAKTSFSLSCIALSILLASTWRLAEPPRGFDGFEEKGKAAFRRSNNGRYDELKEFKSGSRQWVLLVRDRGTGELLVAKGPKRESHRERWIRESKKEMRITGRLAANANHFNANGFDFPLSRFDDDANPSFVMQTFVKGKRLDQELLASLPPFYFERLARDLAEFIYKMHHDADYMSWEWGSVFMDATPWRAVNGSAHMASPYVRAKLLHALCFGLDPDKYGRKNAFAHDDLRPPNMNYDIKTGRIGILDFGLARVLSIYTDFAKLMYVDARLAARVVHYYNGLSRAKGYDDAEIDAKVALAFALVKVHPWHYTIERYVPEGYLGEYRRPFETLLAEYERQVEAASPWPYVNGAMCREPGNSRLFEQPWLGPARMAGIKIPD
jgi:serine/threonine protein kinase